MKAAVIANGNNWERFDFSQYDIIICADGATRWALTNNIRVDVAIGDMDSLDAEWLENIPQVVRFKSEKDETDSQLAIDYAFEKGADTVHFFGALGGRLDHMLANVFLLLRYAKQGKNVVLMDAESSAFAAKGRIALEGEVGQLISVFPAQGDVIIKSTKGLKYSVSNKALPADTPYFISNVFTQKHIEIDTDGWVVVVIPII